MTEQAETLIQALDRAVDVMGGPRPERGVKAVRSIVFDWLAGKGQLRIDHLVSWDFDDLRTDEVMDSAQKAADRVHRDAGHVGRLDMCGDACRALAEAGAS